MIQAARVVKTQKCHFLLKIAQFMVLKVNSNEHKNTLRHRRDIPGSVLESLGCILCISEIFEKFYAFLQPERYSLILEKNGKSDFAGDTKGYRSGCKNA